MAQQGYVYLIWMHGTDKYKLGLSKDPEGRLRQLQTANVHKLSIVCTKQCDDCDAEESRLHAKFDKYRVQGEYFAFHPLFLSEVLSEFNYSPKNDLHALADLFVESISKGVDEIAEYYPQNSSDNDDEGTRINRCANYHFREGYVHGALAYLKKLKPYHSNVKELFNYGMIRYSDDDEKEKAKWEDWLTFKFGSVYSRDDYKADLSCNRWFTSKGEDRTGKVDWQAVKQHLTTKVSELKDAVQEEKPDHVCIPLPDPWSDQEAA